MDWSNLRTINGSQDEAFEELICQLAHQEVIPDSTKFIRKGRPDAGVECYWLRSSQTELAWQAKFFRQALGPVQWRQIDDSVRIALDKHPRLVSYTIALPQDRPDARRNNTKSTLDRWNEHSTKWGQWASERNMTVEFQYWGHHEILSRLSLDANAGRYRFWFDRDVLSTSWEKEHIEQQIANAGPRYTPAANVALPLSSTFDWLCRNKTAQHAILRALGDYNQEWQHASRALQRVEQPLDVLQLTQLSEQVIALRMAVPADPAEPVSLSQWNTLIDSAMEVVQRIRNQLVSHPLAEGYETRAQPHDHFAGHMFREPIQQIDQLDYRLRLIKRITDRDEAALMERPALLVRGKAGVGKTHLLCDLAFSRLTAGLPTILLLGEQFADDEPWAQIIKIAGVRCQTSDELLGALDARAELHGERALIILDALNEEQGVSLWRRFIHGVLAKIARYPRIGIIISIRHGYEESILGDDIERWPLAVWHSGFDDVLTDACQRYFEHYKIRHPTIPLLHPEFANPLFLKTFCKAVSNSGLTSIPEGVEGITKVSDLFVRSLRRPVWGDRFADIDPHAARIDACIEALAARIADSEHYWIPVQEAEAAVAQHLGPDAPAQKLGILVSEGILARDMYYAPDLVRVEGIRFGYERFADHLVARHLLSKYCSAEDVIGSFDAGTKLGRLVHAPTDGWLPPGPLEAIAVQLPERFGIELLDVLRQEEVVGAHVQAFLESLIWRSTNAISNHTSDLVKRNLRGRNVALVRAIVGVLLHTATRVGHPLNGHCVHGFLWPMDMAKRDWIWSIFIHEDWERKGATRRLVDWALAAKDQQISNVELLRLSGITLAWLFTSSDRFLRDRSTKALVSLYQYHCSEMIWLLEHFDGVNDPYVAERLYAAAYAVVLRSTDHEQTCVLGEWVHEHIFKRHPVLPHLMLRDYARGIVVSSGVTQTTDECLPPFESEWPEQLPTADELKPYFDRNSPTRLGEQASRIEFSVEHWDWGNYVVNTGHWSNVRRGETRSDVPAADAAVDVLSDFARSLTPRQGQLLGEYVAATVPLAQELDEGTMEKRLRTRFLRSMGRAKRAYFTSTVEPYCNAVIGAEASLDRKQVTFPKELVKRFVLDWVRKSGWKGEWFDSFDGFVDRHYMRDSHKPERIGKKYQWIAYHEAIARLSDNYAYRGDRWEGMDYEGPWQLNRRDIDPSVILPRTNDTDWSSTPVSWWNPAFDPLFEDGASHEEWLRSSHGLLDCQRAIDVAIDSSHRWFVLDNYAHLKQPLPPGEDRSDLERRRIWWSIYAFLVDATQVGEIEGWIDTRTIGYYDSPSTDLPYEMFYGEYPKHLNLFGIDVDEFEDGNRGSRPQTLPVPCRCASVRYSRDGRGYDCSMDGAIRIRVPSPTLIDGLGLSGRSMDGKWIDKQGRTIAFDPAVFEVGPATLLVSRDHLLTWLERSGKSLVWLVRGEKQVYGGASSYENWPGRLLFQGGFVLRDGVPVGDLRTWFHEPGTRPDGSG